MKNMDAGTVEYLRKMATKLENAAMAMERAGADEEAVTAMLDAACGIQKWIVAETGVKK